VKEPTLDHEEEEEVCQSLEEPFKRGDDFELN